jgi:hypothetical protein
MSLLYHVAAVPHKKDIPTTEIVVTAYILLPWHPLGAGRNSRIGSLLTIASSLFISASLFLHQVCTWCVEAGQQNKKQQTLVKAQTQHKHLFPLRVLEVSCTCLFTM